MDLTTIINDPLFLIFVLILVFYAILFFLVKQWGFPSFARKFPLMKRLFGVRLVIFEVRANGYDIFEDRARRLVKLDQTQFFQTLSYGDIPAPKFEEVQMFRGAGNMVFMLMTAEGEFHPLKFKSTLDAEGKNIYELEATTEEQKYFLTQQIIDGHIKYARKLQLIEKLIQMLPYLIGGFVMIILVWLLLQNVGSIFDQLNTLQMSMKAESDLLYKIAQSLHGGNVSIPVGNFTY